MKETPWSTRAGDARRVVTLYWWHIWRRATSRKGLQFALYIVAVYLLTIAYSSIAPERIGLRRAANVGVEWLSRVGQPLVLLALAIGLIVIGYKLSRPIASSSKSRTNVLPLAVHITVLLAASVITASGFAYLLWHVLGEPSLKVSSPAATPLTPTPAPTRPPAWTVQNTLDGTRVVLAVVGGVGAVVALTIAYRRQRSGEVAEHREDTRLYTERFSKAAELLGSEEAAVRLAGIHAVSALADDWPEGRQTCIDILCAYMRMPYTPLPNESNSRSSLLCGPLTRIRARLAGGGTADSPCAGQQSGPMSDLRRKIQGERQVRLALINIIRNHLQKDAQQSWHGHDFDFSGVRGGSLMFTVSELTGTTIDLPEVTLDGGDITFDEVKITSSRIDFDRAQLLNGTIDFVTATIGSDARINLATISKKEGSIKFAENASLPAGVLLMPSDDRRQEHATA